MLPKIYALIISAFCISLLAAMDPSENQPWEKKLAELTNGRSSGRNSPHETTAGTC
jgi:hypothetical protein